MQAVPERVVLKREADKITVGDNIRIEREAQKLSQDELADMLGTTRKMVSRYENGAQEMGINTFIQYCDALKVKPERLLPERLKECGAQSKADRLAELAADLPDEDVDYLLLLAKRLKGK